MNEHKPVILLVEDNPDDVELTLRAFKKNKVANEVVVARDGVEAVDWLFCTGQYADRDPAIRSYIVLLDLKLPKLDGLEVLRRIRADKRTRLVPVIILTSSNEEQDLIDSYSLHCNSYIRKPVSFERFVDAIRDLELYWLVLNQPPPPKAMVHQELNTP